MATTTLSFARPISTVMRFPWRHPSTRAAASAAVLGRRLGTYKEDDGLVFLQDRSGSGTSQNNEGRHCYSNTAAAAGEEEGKYGKFKPPIMDEDGYLKFDTLHEMVRNATSAYESNPLFGTFATKGEKNVKNVDVDQGDGNGGDYFRWTTYGEFERDVAHCRSVLSDRLGIRPHSKVGIISDNRREWATIAAAAYSLNVAVVPMYESQMTKDWVHILNDSGCSALFCSREEIYLRARREVLPNVPSIGNDDVLCFDAPSDEPHSFRGAMKMMAAQAAAAGTVVVEPSPEDLANLIYTSGTTGKPKVRKERFEVQ